MAAKFARDPHGIKVPDHNGAVDATRGEVLALLIEAQTCRMAGADSVGDVLGIVLQEVII